MDFKELHRRALEAVRKFFWAEAELLELIRKIDACKISNRKEPGER